MILRYSLALRFTYIQVYFMAVRSEQLTVSHRLNSSFSPFSLKSFEGISSFSLVAVQFIPQSSLVHQYDVGIFGKLGNSSEMFPPLLFASINHLLKLQKKTN